MSIFSNFRDIFSWLSHNVGPRSRGTGLDYSSSSNSDIDAYYQANPYNKQTYNTTWIDEIFGSLGLGLFRTGYDKWRDEMALNSAQYDASVVDLEQQRDYNSEVETASRMRDAGLNPDLQGLGDASTSPGLSPDVQDAQIPEADDPLAVCASVGSGIMQLIPTVMSFATNLSQLKGIRLENDAKELQFGKEGLSLANDFFTEGITEQDYKDAFEKNDWTNILKASQSNSDYLTKTLFSSKQARERFKLAYGMHANSLVAKMQKYKTYGDFEKFRKDILSQRASSFFSDDDETMQDLLTSFIAPLEEYNKTMNDINLRYAKKSSQLNLPEDRARLEDQQLSNQSAYEDAIDPVAQASAENAANQYSAQQQEIMKATDEFFASVMKSLAAGDNWWSKIAMAFVGIARAQLMSGMQLQFGRKSNYKVDGSTGEYTEQGQSGFSVGF